jgi:hypothetical protein
MLIDSDVAALVINADSGRRKIVQIVINSMYRMTRSREAGRHTFVPVQ